MRPIHFLCFLPLWAICGVLWFFPCPTSCAQTPLQNQNILPEDLRLLEQSDELAKAALEVTGNAENLDKESEVAMGEMLALLSLKRLPIPTEKELEGKWKVRSLQSNNLGAYAYPYFNCSITREGNALVFHKPNGSQRRLGSLVRDGENRFLFAGATYFSTDQPRDYRGVDHSPTEEDKELNGVAWCYKIGSNRLLMVFPGNQSNLELYELKR